MTQPFLLDTNFISELRRPHPSQGVVNFLALADLDQLYTSVVNLAEIRFGIQMTGDPTMATDLETWLSDRVRPMFAGRVLPLSEDVMLRWRLLVERGRKLGRTYSQPDLLVAATALEYSLALVTRNVKDFTGLGIRLLNPWIEQS